METAVDAKNNLTKQTALLSSIARLWADFKTKLDKLIL